MPRTFEELELNPALITALQKEAITVPTDIQDKVIPEALKGRDVVAQSETGTGKTLAYLLPIFEKLKDAGPGVQAVIIAPTYELVIQIQRQMERLAENSGFTVKTAPMIGNANIKRQIEKLKEKPQIIVGSAGRLLELIRKSKIQPQSIKTLVLDEADRLTDLQNIETIDAIIKRLPKERQIMLFSATISQRAVDISKVFLTDPVILKSGDGITIPEGIEHLYITVEQRDKIETLRKIIKMIQPEKTLVFLNKNDLIDILASKLSYHGIPAEGIHGVNVKLDRKRTMDNFRSGKLPVLIASDIAARGLHIDGISHIFHMDLPEDPKDYLHRAGRTGRNGKPGVSIAIVTKNDHLQLRKIEKMFNIKIQPRKLYNGKMHEEEEDSY